ncbi:MAG: rbsK [Firmicutes bacterium]|nr:rbsK [Bacillota bacterium]
MQKKVLVVGSLNMDLVTELDKMPNVGETVLGSELRYIPGGKGANQACAVGKLGGSVKMLGCIGDDEFGRIQKEALSKSNVDVTNLKITNGHNTGAALIYIDSEGNNSIIVIPGANMECDIEYLKQKDLLFQESDIILLQMEIPYDAIYYAISRAKELNKIVILNPAPAPKEIPDETFNMIDYLTPNETELLKMIRGTSLEQDSMKKAARQLIEKGTKNVIVTLGERGALFTNAEDAIIYPVRKVKAKDTTAAGDSFVGAFAVALAEGKSNKEAIEFANLVSSVVVTKKGAQSSIPERSVIDKLAQELL